MGTASMVSLLLLTVVTLCTVVTSAQDTADTKYPFGFWYDGDEEERPHVRNGRMVQALTEDDLFDNRLYDVLGRWKVQAERKRGNPIKVNERRPKENLATLTEEIVPTVNPIQRRSFSAFLSTFLGQGDLKGISDMVSRIEPRVSPRLKRREQLAGF